MSEDTASPRDTQHQEIEDSLTSVGQRHINVMWETTQRNIAYAVMGVYLLGCLIGLASQLMRGEKVDLQPSLTGIVGFVVGVYFNRTNHEKTGGVGPKHRGR